MGWVAFFALWSAAPAEELRIATSAEWNEWARPGNAVDTGLGRVQPSFVRRNIDAVADADIHGGGIHAAGSNAGRAFGLIDGDPATYWAPDWNVAPENMYIAAGVLPGPAGQWRALFRFDRPPRAQHCAL